MTTLDESKPIKGNDPLWSMMWYQNPDYVDDVTGKKRKDQFNDGFKHDMGIAAAWNMGYSGKGVVVSIIDDGIEYTHDDLKKNYDPKASKVSNFLLIIWVQNVIRILMDMTMIHSHIIMAEMLTFHSMIPKNTLVKRPNHV